MNVPPAKTQISLGIRPVWSESSLCAQWVAKDPSILHADSEHSDQTGRMPRLIWVFAERTLTLLVLSCRGSYPYNRISWFQSKKHPITAQNSGKKDIKPQVHWGIQRSMVQKCQERSVKTNIWNIWNASSINHIFLSQLFYCYIENLTKINIYNALFYTLSRFQAQVNILKQLANS